ncbi:MAG: mitogen-activated kinase kinase 6-like [Trebouxia sp. A1-2]|nr:MAG: mitogen-activated kinase kinase 6-like [Trebouxia sp. A1-2]
MPPKLKLAVGSVSHYPLESITNAPLRESMQCTDTGTLRVTSKSLQEYRFTSEGMTRGNSGALRTDQHYKISQKDLQILDTLGRGASSVVMKAFYLKGNAFVAIKRINVFEKIAIVLEYMDGGSLGDILQKVRKVPEPVLAAITAQLLPGLLHLHRRSHMVHRDIKPANVLLSLNGDAKITDFGISAFVDSTLAVVSYVKAHTDPMMTHQCYGNFHWKGFLACWHDTMFALQCNTFTGTVTYMSPERINSQPYSFPADIWSLGLTLLEAATGNYPYDASGGPLQLMIQVVEDDVPLPACQQHSPEFVDLIKQCLEKDPYKRPTAEALLGHPFLRKHSTERLAVRSFMAQAYSQDERLAAVAASMTTRYYALVAGGHMGTAGLVDLYRDDSVLTHDGATVRGIDDIMSKLTSIVELHKAFGMSYRAQYTDVTPWLKILPLSQDSIVTANMSDDAPTVMMFPFSLD